ncbi:MAG: hypothetical protein ABI396_09395 [Ktedonobacteraceae bacterium]
MAPSKPMLGDIELQQVEKIEVNEDQVLTQQSIPALEGDFLQHLGRRSTRISLTGVLTGAEAGAGLKTLQEKFRAAAPISFVADIATATKVEKVLIEEMGIRELAGKPARFEYAITIIEYIPPPPPNQTVAAQSIAQATQPVDQAAAADADANQKKVENQIVARQGALEVTVELSDPDADFSGIQILVKGKTDDGQDYSIVLTEQTNGVFRKTDVAVGTYTVTLSKTN